MHGKHRLLLVGIAAAGVTVISQHRAEAVYGKVTYSSCAGVNTSDVELAARWMRVATRSPVFASCLDAAMRTGGVGPTSSWGKYRKCWTSQGGVHQTGQRDPFYDSSIDIQVARLLDTARSANDLQINCPSTCTTDAQCGWPMSGEHCMPSGRCQSGTSSAVGLESAYAITTVEALTTQVAPIAWSTAGEAGALAHEAMHAHGYRHGSTDVESGPDDDAGSCGYDPDDPTFVSGNNTAPYLVGNCVEYVLEQSQAACGSSFDNSCPNGGLRMISGLGSTQCGACVADQHDPFTLTGYVCMAGRSPAGVDPKAGSTGFVYVSINNAPDCGGTPLEDGYLYSTGSTYTGTHWLAGALYSGAALDAIYRSLQRAAKGHQHVTLIGTNERPHFQVQSVTIGNM
jgi:hypothetical protein